MPSLELETVWEVLKEDTRHRTFVETGTCSGETIARMEPFFDRLVTIEIDAKLHEAAKRPSDKIEYVLGDTCQVLPCVLATLTTPTLFFLDAHFSGGATGRGPKDCPLLEEVALIAQQCRQRAILIIDDFRLFGTRGQEDWAEISKQAIVETLGSRIERMYHLASPLDPQDRLVLHLRGLPRLLSVQLCGGLGNQLFQVATVLAAARDYDRVPVFEQLAQSPSVFAPRSVYWHNVFHRVPGVQNMQQTPWRVLHESSAWREALASSAEDCQLQGYFQNAAHFDKHKDEILRILSLSEEQQAIIDAAYERQNPRKLHSVSVHVRRGDYIQLNVALPLAYYRRALRQFAQSQILVFSDDIAWCREHFSAPNVQFIGDELADWQQLYLMAKCDAHVLANSSFSFWGQYLDSKPLRRVLAPNRWLGEPTNIYQSHWQILAVEKDEPRAEVRIDYSGYVACLREAVQKSDLSSFKSDPRFRAIVTTVSAEQGQAYRNALRDEFPLVSTERVQQFVERNDRIGGIVYGSPEPTTLRYAYHANVILRQAKEQGYHITDFFEVGGGYGGLCLAIHAFADLHGIVVRSFSIVDIPEAIALQKRYLALHGIEVTEDARDGMFFISNYAFSEFPQAQQELYRDTCLSRCPHGFLAWNFPGCGDPATLLGKNGVHCAPERPLTGPGNLFVSF